MRNACLLVTVPMFVEDGVDSDGENRTDNRKTAVLRVGVLLEPNQIP